MDNMWTKYILLMALIIIPACSSGQGQTGDNNVMIDEKTLLGQVNAPEFPSGMEWLNTDRPLTLGELRGKIVLLDFWTFCCINCLHVIPDLKKLEAKYPDELVVIGVHSAKFTNEKDSDAIRRAILRYEIEHPVVNDHDFRIWQAYGARAWPTLVLINPNGKVIGVHSGEGIYEPFDRIISQAITFFDSRGELKRGRLDLALEKESQPATLLSFPGKVKADPQKKRLFITDSNHNRIIVTDPDGRIIDVIGSGDVGRADGSFAGATFDHPQGTAIDGDMLYIADTENHLIRAADLDSRTVTTILGTGSQARSFNQPGTGLDVAINSPWDLVVHDNILYIAMAGSHQLWSADLATRVAAPYAGSGREARTDGPLLEAALAQPSGITTDGQRLYFADSETSSIRAADLDPGGRVETLIGDDLFEYGDIDGGIGRARLQHPLGVVWHGGKLYITDTYNSKIKIIDPAGKTSTTYTGTGKHGDRDGTLSNARFNEPSGLTVLDNKLYIADANNHKIRVIDLQTETVRTLELTNLDVLAKREMDEFYGREIVLDKQTVKNGDGILKLTVGLPDGYILTANAPLFIDWKTSDSGVMRFNRTNESFKLDPSSFPLDIPFTASEGMTELNIDAVIYFCEDDNKSLCLVDNIRLTVPVDVNDSGPDNVVSNDVGSDNAGSNNVGSNDVGSGDARSGNARSGNSSSNTLNIEISAMAQPM